LLVMAFESDSRRQVNCLFLRDKPAASRAGFGRCA
jgi:hypothetical protein